MATHIGSVKGLWDSLHKASSQLTLLSFTDQNEQSLHLQEFFTELINSFPVQVLLVQASPETLGLLTHFSVTKVPTTLFMIGFVEQVRIEGSHIPDLVSQVELLTCSFSSIFESIRNAQYTKLQNIISQHKLTVFAKGTQNSPQSRRSLKIKRILNGYDYTYFDLNTDPILAQWLQVYTNFKVLPVYFIDSNLQGSIEELVEQTKTGDLFKLLGQDLNERLKKLTNSSKYIVAMMGSKEEPICGFSKRLIAVLNKYGIDFDSFDISFDAEVCEGLKKFSNWPTYPQVYVEGELIGGYDICCQMDTDGSLREALKLT